MYKELINELAKNIKHAGPQKPAAFSEIQEAEEIVGCRFPAELRALLTEMNGDRWLLFSTEEIMEVALSTREYLSESIDDIDRHIFFGGNGCGDYYCYNVMSDGSVENDRIYIWEHEINKTSFAASSISELIRRYYNDEVQS